MEKSSAPVETMRRFEVIQDLRYFAHPSFYHSLLSWSTPRLKALLVYYREVAKEGNSGEIGNQNPIPFMEIRTQISVLRK
ncbi:MAG TPA: hypothetical protein PKG74_02220 [Candidatus Colwellbacteria bacterium]|nr:hypothetical protein [Candidatus Colwellbacteria bacterium]